MKIGIIGCGGKMGRQLVKAVLESPHCTLSGGTERTESNVTGADLGLLAGIDTTNLTVSEDIEALIKASDAIIEFTSPEFTLQIAELTNTHNTLHVSGTTGFTHKQFEQFKNQAINAPKLWGSNMSIGINILNKLTEQVASLLDESFDIEIVEMHHRHKVDAPSGTALTLGTHAAKGRNIDTETHNILSREGITGKRETGKIGYATLRGGDVVGDHTVIFAGEDERIELTHKAASRAIFAKGALRACLWLEGKEPKMYNIADVINTP